MTLQKKSSDNNFHLYDFYTLFNQDILLSYKGPFDEYILAQIGTYIKQIIAKDPKASKKMFNIFIELAQNISFYSDELNNLDIEKKIGIGTLVIAEFENHYAFSTGNIVRNDDVVAVIEKCEIINSLDREGLRQYKREQRKLPQGPRGSGHIGLIQVALTAANPLEFEVVPVNDRHSFFSIVVNINKYKKDL